ncbi:hypothetical protein O0544_01950 [Edwardsiella anguillarum]|nr:hypothetical protein [Edwardsiella anguillarum]
MMINGVFTEAPLPPSATPRSEPAPGRRDIATQCDLLGIEAPRSRAPGAPIPLDQLRAQAQEAEQRPRPAASRWRNAPLSPKCSPWSRPAPC